MTTDQFLTTEFFLQALEKYYDDWLYRVDDELLGEENIFSPAFNRKMEELINGGPNQP